MVFIVENMGAHRRHNMKFGAMDLKVLVADKHIAVLSYTNLSL